MMSRPNIALQYSLIVGLFSCGQPEVKNLRTKIGDGGGYEDTSKYEDVVKTSLPPNIKIQVQSNVAPMFELPIEYISSPEIIKVYNHTNDEYMSLEFKKIGDVYRFYIVGGVEYGLNNLSVFIGDLYEIPGEVVKRDFTYFGTLLTSRTNLEQNPNATLDSGVRFESWVNGLLSSGETAGLSFVSGIMNVINQ